MAVESLASRSSTLPTVTAPTMALVAVFPLLLKTRPAAPGAV